MTGRRGDVGRSFYLAGTIQGLPSETLVKTTQDCMTSSWSSSGNAYRRFTTSGTLAMASTIPVPPRSSTHGVSTHGVSRRARSSSVHPNCGGDYVYKSPEELQKVSARSDILSTRASISPSKRALCGNFLSTVWTKIFS